jgi:hypothetical protein
MTGEWPEHEIDHEDLNKINNKWKNLRQATGSQNKANIRAQANNKLGVKGVIQRPYNRFEVNLKRKYIGTFDTIEEASKAYEAAAKEYYGEFTRIE